jgi:hypothetical protein
VLHPRQVKQSAGFPGAAWVRWGSFSVYGIKLHLIYSTNRIPISYELTSANVADISLTEELVAEAALGERIARRLFGDLAYRSEALEDALAESGTLLIEGSYQHGKSELDLLARFFLAFGEVARQADRREDTETVVAAMSQPYSQGQTDGRTN